MKRRRRHRAVWQRSASGQSPLCAAVLDRGETDRLAIVALDAETVGPASWGVVSTCCVTGHSEEKCNEFHKNSFLFDY